MLCKDLELYIHYLKDFSHNRPLNPYKQLETI